jgi:hypothetical protein
MTTTHDTAPPTATVPAEAAARPAAAPRSPRAVRPAVNAKLVAAAVGIIVVCTAGAAALFSLVSGTSPVVVAAAPLAKGQLIGQADLGTAAVASDPGVATVPADQLASLIGQRAAVDVPAGALLAPASVTSDPIPGSGKALVGIQVTSAQAPLAELDPGTPVRLVHVPDAAAPATEGSAAGAPVPAVVVSSGFAPDGARVIDVTVPAAAAATVSGWAAAGDVAVVVDTVAR